MTVFCLQAVWFSAQCQGLPSEPVLSAVGGIVKRFPAVELESA